MKNTKANTNRFLSSALVCLALVGCTTATPIPVANNNTGVAPASVTAPAASLPQITPGTMPEGSQNLNQGTKIQVRSGIQGLSPRLQKMIQHARQQMETPGFQTRMRQGDHVIQRSGDFGIQATREGTPKMFATGTNTSGATNIIYEINTSDYSATEISTLPNWFGSAFGLAKHPVDGKIYALTSGTDGDGNVYMTRYEEGAGGHEFAGRFNAGAVPPKMGFSRDGELYVSTPQALFKVDHTQTPDINDQSTYGISAVNQNIANWSAVTGDATGGDLAFSYDGRLIMGAGQSLYEVDLTNQTVVKLADLTLDANIAAVGFSPDDKLWVSDYNGNGGNPITSLYEVNLDDYSTQKLNTYTTGQSIYDMSSSQWHNCPDTSAARPGAPTFLFNNDFASYSGLPNFGNLPGETNPDTTSGWKQWNGDYFPAGSGVVLHNPGHYDPSPGGIDDPNNDILGIRNFPGEYSADRQNLLETSIAKSAQLNYTQGDRVKAKLKAAPTFTHGDSDVTLMICFDDPAETVAVSSTLRGNQVKGSELVVDVEIPECATTATVVAMGYLGETEDSSLTFEEASLEFIPQNHYTTTNLLNATFDASGTHETYGDNFPTEMDEQFGTYDFYTVDNWPVVAGDLALTAGNPDASTEYGGVVKQVTLPEYDGNDGLSAELYLASTFTNADSEASLLVDFFDANDNKLGTVTSQKVNATQFRHVTIDRASIPAGATYVKVVPIIKLGAGETGGFLMDNLKVDLHRAP